MQDMQELMETGKLAERKCRLQIRCERNIEAIENAYAASLEIAQQVITNMCKKTAEENIADVTQFIVEGLITQKIATCALQRSKFVGSGLVQVGIELLEKVPPSILNKQIEFIVMPGGAVIGVIAETGESIADIIIAAGKELVDSFEKGVHLAAQANNLARKGGGNSNGGKSEVEPQAGTSEYSKKYLNGKYKQSPKHHVNSPDNIGKPPCDGPAALDNSFDVKGSTQRVTVQDGKIVVLKFEEEGIYHGSILYIIIL